MSRPLLALLIAAAIVVTLATGLPWLLRHREDRGARLLFEQGETRLLEGNPAAAEEAFRRALQRDPGHPRAARALADILLAREEWTGARALYETARRGGLADAKLLHRLGVAALESDDLDGAIAALRAALAAGGGDAPRIRVPLGLALHEAGDDTGAEEALSRAVEEDPRDLQALLGLASLREEHGRLDEALTLYDRAVTLHPRAADAQKRRGAVLMRQGKFGEAAESYRRAVEIAPDDADALILLGNAHEAMGQLLQARGCFEGALRLDRGSFLATLDLAAMNVREGRTLEAASLLERAMDLEPDSPYPPLFLGRILLERGKTADARLLFERAVQLAPGLADARVDLAALLRFTDPAAAEAALRQALLTDPAHPDAHRDLADILISRGEKAEAATHLRIVLAKDPADEKTRLLLQRIEASLAAPGPSGPAAAPPASPGPPAGPSGPARQDQRP